MTRAAARGASAWAFLFTLLFALGACSSSSSSSSDGDGSSGAGGDGDCGIETAPYLSVSPTITPTTGTIDTDNGFQVSLDAEGAVDITDVVVWLYDFDYGPDSTAVSFAAFGGLEPSAGSTTWSGTLIDNIGSVYGNVVAGTHYLWIVLTNGENTFTEYWHDTTESETKYYCVQLILQDDGETYDYSYGLSDLDIVTVEMSN